MVILLVIVIKQTTNKSQKQSKQYKKYENVMEKRIPLKKNKKKTTITI
jgi:hypothetical protein